MLLRPSFGMSITYKKLKLEECDLNIDDTNIKTVSPACSFVLLCVHHGVNEGWSKVKYLLDIHMAIEYVNAAGSWEHVMSIADRLGVLRVVHCSLLMVNRYLKSAIPEQFLNAALADASAKKLSDENDFLIEVSHWTELKRKLALNNRASSVGLVFNHFMELASPTYADQEFVRLPDPGKLFWMYYFI